MSTQGRNGMAMAINAPGAKATPQNGQTTKKLVMKPLKCMYSHGHQCMQQHCHEHHFSCINRHPRVSVADFDAYQACTVLPAHCIVPVSMHRHCCAELC